MALPRIQRVLVNDEDIMRVFKSDGTSVDIDIGDYITFGTNVIGRVYAFSTYDEPDSFVYSTGPDAFGPPLTSQQLDHLVNHGKQRPHMGGRHKVYRRRRTLRRKQRHNHSQSRRRM